MSPVDPHEFGGQPPWPMAVRVKLSCATAASQIAVVHDSMTRPAVVAHGGKLPHLYIRRKIAQKCHNNSGKRKRWLGRRGEESEGVE
jgi:hypothetical protein